MHMALKLAHMFTTSLLQSAPAQPQPARLALIRKGRPESRDVEPIGQDREAAHNARRTRIWEVDSSLHCSIIGTCLTTAELRHILDKLKIGGARTASDHDLHSVGVMLAGRREGGAKFLQKALDRQHRAAITRYSSAQDPVAVLGLWEESLKQGDVPAAYWAVLTHPATTDTVVKRVFGDVHMLSHLVGAANRADIRRLRQLEQNNAALVAKVERQQRQLHDGFAARDLTIRRLHEVIARQAGDRSNRADTGERQDSREAVDNLIEGLNQRLAHQTARQERAEQRLSELAAELKQKERALQASQSACEAALQELDIVERHLASLAGPDAHDLEEGLDLAGVTLLYVGGRVNQVPQLKALIERAGARFLHHDGGIEHGAALLPGLVSRADRVFFPIDCVSHDAVATIKRLCRATEKSYVPLRTTSLACLLSALVKISGSRQRIAGAAGRCGLVAQP